MIFQDDCNVTLFAHHNIFFSLPSSSMPSFFSALFHGSVDSVGVCHVLEV